MSMRNRSTREHIYDDDVKSIWQFDSSIAVAVTVVNHQELFFDAGVEALRMKKKALQNGVQQGCKSSSTESEMG
ncbi:hypothetical protein ACET3Z_024830 [Daucus carota]